MNINARSVSLNMTYEIPYLLETNGSIINNANISGYRAFPNIIGYGVSKAAVIHMTKIAAQEYGKSILVSAIALSVVDTLHTKAGAVQLEYHDRTVSRTIPDTAVAQPEEIIQAVMWFASEAASYVSGMRFDIDGGGLG